MLTYNSLKMPIDETTHKKQQLYDSIELWTNKRDQYLARLGTEYRSHRNSSKSFLENHWINQMEDTIALIDNVEKLIQQKRDKLNDL